MQRLIDLVVKTSEPNAAAKPISNLARMELRSLSKRLGESIETCGEKMDAYTIAHLTESQQRIDRALEAGYTYNGSSGQTTMMFMFGKEAPQD